jgi:hypothetical protein
VAAGVWLAQRSNPPTMTALQDTEKVIRCEVEMTGARRIRCESGGGFFCFEFKTGKKIQKLKITDEAAWIMREMLDAMHPRICGSNNPLWHKVQAMRNGSAPSLPLAPNERL